MSKVLMNFAMRQRRFDGPSSTYRTKESTKSISIRKVSSVVKDALLVTLRLKEV